MAMEKMKVP